MRPVTKRTIHSIHSRLILAKKRLDPLKKQGRQPRIHACSVSAEGASALVYVVVAEWRGHPLRPSVPPTFTPAEITEDRLAKTAAEIRLARSRAKTPEDWAAVHGLETLLAHARLQAAKRSLAHLTEKARN